MNKVGVSQNCFNAKDEFKQSRDYITESVNESNIHHRFTYLRRLAIVYRYTACNGFIFVKRICKR